MKTWQTPLAIMTIFCFVVAVAPPAFSEEPLPIGAPDFPRNIWKRLNKPRKPEKEIKLGILKFHPSFVSKMTVDDNIFLKPTDEASDVIWTQMPGVVLDAEVGDHRLEAGYGAEFVNFTKHEGENAVNNLGHAAAEINFDELQFKLEDAFEEITNRTFTDTSDRDNVILNTAKGLARYDRPNWAAEAGWTHNTVSHQSEPFESRSYNEDIAAVLAGYKIFPKTLLLVETDLGWVNYRINRTNADQDFWQILGGLRGEVTEKIRYTAKVGFQNRQLGDVPEGGLQQIDYQGLVWNGEISYKPDADHVIRAGSVRSVQQSTFTNNTWYLENKIYANYTGRFFKKFLVTPKLAWRFHDYSESATVENETQRRADHFWQAGLGLRYELTDWASTGVEYNFRERASNFGAFDYDNNIMTVDVTFAL